MTINNPLPGIDNVAYQHYQFRINVQKSFIRLLKEAGRVLKKESEKICFDISSLDSNKKFSPYFYSYYFSLLALMASKDKVKCNIFYDNLSQKINSSMMHCEGISIRNMQDNDWDNNFTREIFGNYPTDIFEKVEQQEFFRQKEKFKEALNVLKKVYPNSFIEINEYLSSIILLQTNSEAHSASSIKFFGGIPINIPSNEVDSLLFYLDVIVHESAHFSLNIMMSADNIITNSQTELYHSPARNEPRPMKGIFHAHFVFFRLLLLYSKIAHFFPDTKSVIQDFDLSKGIKKLPWDFHLRFAGFKKKFEEGENIIRKNAKLTNAGQELFQLMSEYYRKLIMEF